MVVPRDVVYEKFRVPSIVKSYSRITDVEPLPHMVQIQIDSYEVFKKESLRELFDEISPISDFTGNRLEMRFTDYHFDEPKYNLEECRERDATLAAPLRVTVQLTIKETKEIKEQEIFMGDFPLMTDKGTFIINGAERVVVSQLVRSPGVYLTLERDATSGRALCYAKLIPNRGAWLEFETSNKGVISVKVDRKRKIPITTLLRAIDEPELLAKHSSAKEIKELQERIDTAKTEREADKLRSQMLKLLGSNDRILAIFEDVDNNQDRQFIQSTLDRDPSSATKEEALLEFYRRLRPGDPPTIDNAKQLINSLFFNPRRYDLGKVGRYKVNKRLSRPQDNKERVLAPADLIAIVKEIIRLNNGFGKSDDIDHLGNRRVRTVGELIQNQFRIGLLRMERVIRERMTITDPNETAPSQLINIRPVVAAIKEFFGGSQLSQFMDQTNPLAELTHKRRLSALGPGGLSRDRAGFDVRDVHFSHYGRICPIETPEGPNIGLIGSLATYGRVNEYGFIETPYRKVYHELPKNSAQLVNRFIREDVLDGKGKVIAAAGTEIDAAVAKKLTGAADKTVQIRPFVSSDVDYLSADEEERHVVAQANEPLDERGHFLEERIEARTDTFTIKHPEEVQYMDLSPKQIVSVAASLIPFLEHDDANRALMGANMQRQAVPLVRPEIPLVGTGMELQTAVDSGQVITAEDAGVVKSVTGEGITVAYGKTERTYKLHKFIRSNQGTCINQRAIVTSGQAVKRGDTLADSSSTDEGELALGQTLLCAFMSWEGYNFEDAIIISESVARDDKFTSIHVEKHEVEARDTKLGPEEITRDIPNVGEESLLDLDEYGIIRVGAEVQSGDILVGKITPKGETELTAEEKLLRAIFGEKAREVKDTSLRVPHGERGKVIETRFFARPDNDSGRPPHPTDEDPSPTHFCRWPAYAQITDELQPGVQAMVRISIAQRRKVAEGDKMAGRHGNKGVISRILPVADMPHLEDGTPVDIILNPIGVPSRMNIGQVLETHLGWAARRMGFRAISPVFDGGNPATIEDALCRAWICEAAGALVDDIETIGPPIQRRNGSTNDLGTIGEKVDVEKARKWIKDRGHDPDVVFDDSLENVGEAARIGIELWLEQPHIKEWLSENGHKRFKGKSYHDLEEIAEKVLLATGQASPTYGKQVLYDGRTGERFDQAVTVGYIYMLKLVHLVEDKIHARSTGPYSLITQQPLGGKAQFGGQRFGEMEVWALEAYGAAHILQELLTVKSDDVVGRVKTYEAIVKGEDILEPGVPESFKVLVKELQSLGLSVEVLNEEEERVMLADTSMQDLPELGIDLSGFEKGRTYVALEVNDFNAIRISLASNEQIRSWSYGEVTKPETINYRTLKPEKDGLFDEKIFGPTKDFECYCGKYKRVRYKGIVCDKCGVEVTRSKVRRERMGHIQLASPVAHIWFVKGTPSRIGLLLDISPRSLERVLYFAQFIVSEVNEEARQKAIDELKRQMDEAVDAGESEEFDKIKEIEEQTAEAIALLETEREARMAAAEATIDTDIEALREKAATLKADIEKVGEKKAPKKLGLDDKFILATKGETLPAKALAKLETELKKRVSGLEDSRPARRAAAEAQLQKDISGLRDAATSTMEPHRKKVNSERDAIREQYLVQIEKLEDLRDPIKDDQCTLLPESDLREWNEKFPGLVKAGMGAEALLGILERVELDPLKEKLKAEIQNFSGQRRKKATKRLRVVESLRKSGNKPEWMILSILPVLPPDLRPMVQLDGGRFATSDLNDLYRRVINRNNRLKRLLELGAPEIIIRNEKRMLQEAVDSLIDNGRRGRAVSTAGNHKLKSLSDMLKGKQGRFRQNLLGKRVDYSGRSVIVVGPELKLHQCGLPKRMALELFKPFVMHGLVARGLAHNIKSAKRIVERARPEVWDILDEIIRERPVLLNRAPTLHRLGIQAFEPVLIDGSAIQIHPLVCTAFNADFDGDQMAVHVPLSRAAVAEARQIMLSSQNLLYPSNGEPVVAPTLDIVLGCYYLTEERPGSPGSYEEGPPPRGLYASFDEAKMAYQSGYLDLRAPVRVRDKMTGGEIVATTVGRMIFNEVVPPQLGFRNQLMDKKTIKDLVAECSHTLDNETTAEVVDKMKDVGFKYATQSGISISMNDLRIPDEKAGRLESADREVSEIEEQYEMGLITEDERYEHAIRIWRDTTDLVQGDIQKRLKEYGGVYIMAVSGAKGNISQISQMAGMRGLMSDPSGRIIDLPIRSSFREGLSVLEYFISTHGARKGLADTALRTADSGYLTRRLIDVAQDVIIVEDDCGTTAGVWVGEPSEKGLFESLTERIIGRYTAADIADPKTGEIIVERGDEIMEDAADRIVAVGIDKVYVRSALTCVIRRGLCATCYGRDLSRGRFVAHGEAVGIIGAQSIGEPGTQLTMRTFHTGGVAGLDITSGLPRVEELFEARVPKGSALISEIDGVAELQRDGDARRLRILSSEDYKDEYDLPKGAKILVKDGDDVAAGQTIATLPKPKKGQEEQAVVPGDIIARVTGQANVQRGGRLSITYEERDQREYVVPAAARLRVQDGAKVLAGEALTEGPLNPQDILRIQGPEKVQLYLVEEVQKVYRSQGVTINDKHIEVIVRQMLRRVRVDQQGDTELLPGELVDRFKFETENARVLAEGGEPATAQPVLLGVTKASLNTDSFLAAASFQETTRVLTEASISGQVDRLLGLKENVIIGKLIPARAPIIVEQPLKVAEIPIPPSLMGEAPGEDFELFDTDDEDWNLPEPDEDGDDSTPPLGKLSNNLDSLFADVVGGSSEDSADANAPAATIAVEADASEPEAAAEAESLEVEASLDDREPDAEPAEVVIEE